MFDKLPAAFGRTKPSGPYTEKTGLLAEQEGSQYGFRDSTRISRTVFDPDATGSPLTSFREGDDHTQDNVGIFPDSKAPSSYFSTIKKHAPTPKHTICCLAATGVVFSGTIAGLAASAGVPIGTYIKAKYGITIGIAALEALGGVALSTLFFGLCFENNRVAQSRSSTKSQSSLLPAPTTKIMGGKNWNNPTDGGSSDRSEN